MICLKTFVWGNKKMKEYVIYPIKNKMNKYKQGYKIQKLDIELMIELGIKVPNKIKKIYKEGFTEKELSDYVYFKDMETIDFIGRQYYIRDYVEFANMNLYELKLLIKYYKEMLKELDNKISKTKDVDELNNLKTDMNILVNDILSINYLIDKEKKKLIKVRK